MEDHGDIEKELIKHFKSIHQEPNKIVSHIPNVIAEEHNQLLLHSVTFQEVQSAMKQLQEGKAPGLDGFTSTFFHKL